MPGKVTDKKRAELEKRRNETALRFEATARGYGAILSGIGARFPDADYVQLIVDRINAELMPQALSAQEAYEALRPYWRTRRRPVSQIRKKKAA